MSRMLVVTLLLAGCVTVPKLAAPDGDGGVDAGAPTCSGAGCPINDLPTGAIDISAGGQFTVDLATAHDDHASTAAGCGAAGGRDVFYQFLLDKADVVYLDTLGSDFDSVVHLYPGGCSAPGALSACWNDACSTTRSQGVAALEAGWYCVVVDQASSAVVLGMSTLVFRRAGRSGTVLSSPAGMIAGDTTSASNQSVAGCEPVTAQPDAAFFFAACPGSAMLAASTCTNTSIDTVLYLRNTDSVPDLACNDDTMGCGTAGRQSTVQTAIQGPGLYWLVVDAYGQPSVPITGAFELTYNITPQ